MNDMHDSGHMSVKSVPARCPTQSRDSVFVRKPDPVYEPGTSSSVTRPLLTGCMLLHNVYRCRSSRSSRKRDAVPQVRRASDHRLRVSSELGFPIQRHLG